MKMKKIIALGVSMAMVLGVVAACDDSSTSETTAATTTAATTAANDDNGGDTQQTDDQQAPVDDSGSLAGFTDLGAQAATNDGTDPILVWSWNDEVGDYIAEYSNVTIKYENVGGGNQNTYQEALENALASGDQAPDLYVTDASWTQRYIQSDNSVPVNDLGIDYADLTDMYAYTLNFSDDDEGVIKGLAWQANPAAVFYNRTVAQEYLGVSEPEDVAPYFATWDAFLKTAQDINTASGGEVKALSAIEDMWQPYQNTRTKAWVQDGEIVIDPALEEYFNFAKTLYDEDLTFMTGQWNDNWTGNASNDKVLSFWGPMWLGRFSLAMSNPDNPTYGNWGVVKAPVDYYWGGTWMMASKTCDMKADAGQIISDLCINPDNLKDMATAKGEYVNSVSIMKAIAEDSSFGLEWLGGQNPFTILFDVAQGIDYSTIGVNDGPINDAFSSAVGSYCSGDYETIADAEAAFKTEAKEAAGL